MDKTQIKNEKDFFNNQTNIKRRHGFARFYPENERMGKCYKSLIATHCVNGAKVLEYGCGEGSFALQIAQAGAAVFGIDIADAQIAHAKKRAAENGLQQNVSFEVMDGEKLTYQDAYFDVVCGTGILHHLNSEIASQEISRVLKPNGHAFFMEPLGTNPFINLFRYFTPSYRTRGEHPLRPHDIKMLKKYFGETQCTFFDASTLLGFLFKGTVRERGMTHMLDAFDQKMFIQLPLTRLFAWRVIIVLQKRESTGSTYGRRGAREL